MKPIARSRHNAEEQPLLNVSPMAAIPPPFHDWDPPTPQEVGEVFMDAPFRWWICGGHALELHTGRSWRSHGDLDIGLLRAETDKVYSWLAEWDLWVAARGQLRPWQGEALEPHHGENNVWARENSESSWRFDLNLGSGDDAGWIYRRDQRTRRSWHAAVLRTPDGLPYLSPELQLLFKSKNPRPKDHLDARQVIPLLIDANQRAFLANYLDDDHPWRHQVPPE